MPGRPTMMANRIEVPLVRTFEFGTEVRNATGQTSSAGATVARRRGKRRTQSLGWARVTDGGVSVCGNLTFLDRASPAHLTMCARCPSAFCWSWGSSSCAVMGYPRRSNASAMAI